MSVPVEETGAAFLLGPQRHKVGKFCLTRISFYLLKLVAWPRSSLMKVAGTIVRIPYHKAGIKTK
jgi:hypothetical protein